MLWVNGHYEYFNSFSVGNVFIRQNLTSTDVRFCRVKTVTALKGLISMMILPVTEPRVYWWPCPA